MIFDLWDFYFEYAQISNIKTWAWDQYLELHADIWNKSKICTGAKTYTIYTNNGDAVGIIKLQFMNPDHCS